MNLFNHEISYNVIEDSFDPKCSARIVSIDYDDAYGDRRNFTHSFLKSQVESVKVGGTAMSSVAVRKGAVVSVRPDNCSLVALSNAQVVNCSYAEDEIIQPNDHIVIAEHLVHEDSVELGRFDWLATKRSADFRLNSIRVILFDKNEVEIGAVYLDPYLFGRVHYGYSRTEY